MRKILRSMAKAKMAEMGYDKVNKRMGNGQWRRAIDAYPTNLRTGKKMQPGYVGTKRGKGHRKDCVYSYC